MWIPVPLPNAIWPPFAFPNTMWIPAAFECGLTPTPYTCSGPPEPSERYPRILRHIRAARAIRYSLSPSLHTQMPIIRAARPNGVREGHGYPHDVSLHVWEQNLCIFTLFSLSVEQHLCIFTLFSLSGAQDLCVFPLFSLSGEQHLCIFPLFSLSGEANLCI